MSEIDRNIILATFQECTNITDVETAIKCLDEHNWILMDAVKSAIPDIVQSSPDLQQAANSHGIVRTHLSNLGAVPHPRIGPNADPPTDAAPRRSSGCMDLTRDSEPETIDTAPFLAPAPVTPPPPPPPPPPAQNGATPIEIDNDSDDHNSDNIVGVTVTYNGPLQQIGSPPHTSPSAAANTSGYSPTTRYTISGIQNMAVSNQRRSLPPGFEDNIPLITRPEGAPIRYRHRRPLNMTSYHPHRQSSSSSSSGPASSPPSIMAIINDLNRSPPSSYSSVTLVNNGGNMSISNHHIDEDDTHEIFDNPMLQHMVAELSRQSRQPGYAPRAGRSLTFRVEYQAIVYNFVINDNNTVENLKYMIKEEVGIASSEFIRLRGWRNTDDFSVTNTDTLRDLNLPIENTLILLRKPSSDFHTPVQSDEDELTTTYTFTILVRFTNETLTVTLQGDAIADEVRIQVANKIQVRKEDQRWSGWHEYVLTGNWGVQLYLAGVQLPNQYVEVDASPILWASIINGPPPSVPLYPNVMADENSDYEEADGLEMYEEPPAPNNRILMIPENITNDVEAVTHFSQIFTLRYGALGPRFYLGRLQDAVKDALTAKVDDRKMLMIYLHNDNSILANVFCSQILCNPQVVEFLTQNCIVWGWDITAEANKSRLLSMCSKSFGNIASNSIRFIRVDEMPIVVLLSRQRGSTEIMAIIKGSITMEEFISKLVSTDNMFKQAQAQDRVLENERIARSTFKMAQDDEYQESLRQDQEKDAKRLADKLAKENEVVEQEIAIKVQIKKNEEAQIEIEAIRKSIRDELPKEPESGPNITSLRFRYGAEVFNRRFLISDRMCLLMDYLFAQGYPSCDYKVLTTFPRRDLTTFDPDKTFEELKIFPQESLILERR